MTCKLSSRAFTVPRVGQLAAPLLLVISLFATSPLLAESKTFSYGIWGSFQIDLPAQWTSTMESSKDGSASAIRLTPPNGVELVLLITPVPADGNVKNLSPRIEAAAQKIVEKLRETSVEKEIPVLELTGPGCQARYAFATDRTVENPSPKNFKYAIQGVAAVGRLLASFTILNNDKESPEQAAALEIIKSARHAPPGPPWRTPSGTIAAVCPGVTTSWKFLLDLPEFEIEPARPNAGGIGLRLAGKNAKSGLTISVHLEAATPELTAAGHRDRAWETTTAKSPWRTTDIKKYEQKNMAILEYTIPKVEGQELNMKNLNAHLVKDGVWIDVHISKEKFSKQDMAQFDKILGTIRFEE